MSRVFRVIAATALAVSGLWIGTAQASAASLPTCTKQDFFFYKPVADNGSDSCIMGYGNQGDGVVALQRALAQCNNIFIGVDGIYGSETKSAVVQIQRAAGITQDGVYGPNTRSHMHFLYIGGSTPYCI